MNKPIIDNNNPGFIFYTVKANYEYFGKEQPTFNNHKNTKQKVKDTSVVTGTYAKLTNDIETPPVTWHPTFISVYDDGPEYVKDTPGVKTSGGFYKSSTELMTDQIIREKLNEIRKSKNLK